MVEINKFIETPKFYLFQVRNGTFKVSDEFILNLQSHGVILVDNDHGGIMSLNLCKQRILNSEDWMYRGDIDNIVIEV